MSILGWFDHRDTLIDDLIVPPIIKFGKAEDIESIRAAAERRRQAADDKRREAAQIATGRQVA